MTKPHVCIRVKNMGESIKYYKRLGYDVGSPILCNSIGGKFVAFGMKKGYPSIELLETGEEVGGFDHLTVGWGYDIDKSQFDILEENIIPELGVKTILFYGINGEKLEIFNDLDQK